MRDIKIRGFKIFYNQLRMNCNYYWQLAPVSMIPGPQTCIYFDQPAIINNKQINYEPQMKQLKKKIKQLELENYQLKEQILILERVKHRKGKRVVKRRKQEELEKKFKCLHFNCKKQYASVLALNLHVKTKHPRNSETKDSVQKDHKSKLTNSIKHQGEYSNTNQ